MKKIIAILFCLVLAFSSVGCSRESRKFSMEGHNVSSLDAKLITEKIIEFEKLDEPTPIHVNAGNPVMLTSDFDWAEDGAINFFFKKKLNTYSAQLRLFNEENQYFITESTKMAEGEKTFKLEHYLDALKYMPQGELESFLPMPISTCCLR